MYLDAIYTKEIRGKMSAATLEGGRRKVHQDRYQWPLFIAIVLLLVERCISAVRIAPLLLFMVISSTLIVPLPTYAKSIQEGIKAYEKGEYSKAIDHFTEAQLDDPERPEVLYNLGSAFYKNKDFDAAETHMREALDKADPDLKAKIHYDLGNIDFRKGRLKEAIKNYEKALKLAPDDNQAKENIEFVKKVMEQKPPPSESQDNNDNKEESSENNKQSQNQSGQKGDNLKDQKEKDSNKTPENENAPKPTSGEMDSDEPEQSDPSSKEESEPEDTKQASSEDMPPSNEPDDQDRKRAEQLLNRLKDQPGKATMPAYGKMPVEKDW
jgi:Ca-activated chloride channel family protein